MAPPGGPLLVSDLIDATLATWKQEVIRDRFLPMDAWVILGIPLCTMNIPDFWAWAFEKKGSFSVRSTYCMLINTKIRREGWLYHDAGPSSAPSENRDGMKLWGAQVPSKLRVFLWRLVNHSLPTFDVLEHMNMTNSQHCVLRGRPDSQRHALVECSMSLCVWALAKPELLEKMVMTTEPHANPVVCLVCSAKSDL